MLFIYKVFSIYDLKLHLLNLCQTQYGKIEIDFIAQVSNHLSPPKTIHYIKRRKREKKEIQR